jgi:hypothetical protein
MRKRVFLAVATAATLACGGGDDPAPATVTAACATAADLCIGRTGPAAQVEAEMTLCVAPHTTRIESCPPGSVGGCRQMDGQVEETTWFYAPTWNAQTAQATCDPPDVWVTGP